MKIGFFDSGLGGLIALKAVAKALPQYDYEFYGDTANLPYGDKSELEIFELTKAGIVHLFKRDCSLVIVACNTASAETLRRLQDGFLKEEYPDHRVLGVIIPTVEELLSCDIKHALLVATKRTVDSGKYERELEKLTDAPLITARATPELVPLIELGEADAALGSLVATIKGVGEVDAVILGCTHYSLLKDGLRSALPQLKVISQDEILPRKLADYLERHEEIKSKLTQGSSRNIYLTDNSSRYDHVIRELLGGAFIEN
jgi:glutamate racemase